MVAIANVSAKVDRLIGGAGTGKTTEILKVMTGALEHLGNDPLALGFASFTTAARATAVTRAAKEWGVAPSLLSRDGWFRTVHSTVFRCLGLTKGQLMSLEEDSGMEWLRERCGVSLSASINTDTGKTEYSGDERWSAALSAWDLSRSSLTPLVDVMRRLQKTAPPDMPSTSTVISMIESYETGKRLDGLYDFSDTLLRFAGISPCPVEGFSSCEPAGEPPDVRYWLFDEQQDASPLLDAVCRRLAAHHTVRRVVMVGDPMQSIYGFSGASASCFMGWPAARERTMPKSYRCAAPILRLGESCLRRMHEGYWDRGIAPADHDGEVRFGGSAFEAACSIKADEEWMFLARTNWQAGHLAGALSELRIPFRWVNSPAGVASPTAIGCRALLDLQAGRPTTGDGWKRAIAMLPARQKNGQPWLVRGAKTKWKEKGIEDDFDAVFPRDLEAVGCTLDLCQAITAGVWPSLVDGGTAFVEQTKKWGVEAATLPKVRVGTVHSAKGMEADNVCVLTTATRRIASAAADDEASHDEECRIGYVAVTRARKRVVLVSDDGPSMEAFA
jgi:DNA helicase-2/ATP-dependent DNA helicase PcrA